METDLHSKILSIYHRMWSLLALAHDISAGLGKEENCRITLYGALSTDFVMQYVLRLRICAFGRYRNSYQP